MASMAMRMPSDLRSSGLGSVQRRESNETNMFSQELEMRKKKESRLNSVKLVKKGKIQISYKYNTYNKSCFKSRGYSYIKASYIMVIIYIK